jgi:hypothetical protein
LETTLKRNLFCDFDQKKLTTKGTKGKEVTKESIETKLSDVFCF